MHRLVRKLRREHSAPNHRHSTISAEEAMRQLCLQRALERQEAQRWVGAEPVTVVDPFAPTWPPFYPTTTTPQAVAFGPTAFGIPQMPMAMMVPPWSMSSPQLVRPPQQFVEEEEVLPANDNDSNEEAELQRAMEESMCEAEERKRKEDEEERRVMQRLRELEEKERLRAELQQRQQQRMEVDDEVLQRLEAEEDARRAALEEAKQVQLALQMSLAAQRQQQQEQQQWADGLRAEGNAPEDVQEDGEVVDDEELADALRLSRLVCKSPEERKREEEAIYRAALIHEQNREFEESRHQDLMKEEAHREVQRERERIRSLLQEARHKEASLVAEPSAASTAGATELVVRMPDGRRVRRRFPVDAALQSIKDWIDVELAKAHELEMKSPATEDEKAQKDDEDGDDEDSEVTNAGSFLVSGYDLVTDFPRRVFTNLHETASEAGLSPRALLNLSKH